MVDGGLGVTIEEVFGVGLDEVSVAREVLVVCLVGRLSAGLDTDRLLIGAFLLCLRTDCDLSRYRLWSEIVLDILGSLVESRAVNLLFSYIISI